MSSWSRWRLTVAFIVSGLLVVFSLANIDIAEGVPPLPNAGAPGLSAPFSAASSTTPPYPLGLFPRSGYGGSLGSDTATISDGMIRNFLPTIPNLQFGYAYTFGKNVRMGRAIADYTLPVKVGAAGTLFGEAHAEFQDFWHKPSVSVSQPPGFALTKTGTASRVDLSFGGGYRTMLNEDLFIGANGFYDTSRLFGRWYSAGGFGFEMAANMPGSGAIDLNFNWYGNLFGRDGFVNAFRNRGGSFDLEAGYSQGLFNNLLDLRLKFAGYQFDVVDKVYGWRTGADFTTRDGVFTAKYEYGYDKLNNSYNSINGYVNVGLHLENLLSLQSPFSAPNPVFKSPRNLRRVLGLPVNRNWHQPAAVVLVRNSPIGGGKPYFVVELSPQAATANWNGPMVPMTLTSSTPTTATFEFTYTGSGEAHLFGNLYLRIGIAGGTPAAGFPVKNVNVVCQDGTLYDAQGVAPFLYFVSIYYGTASTVATGDILQGGFLQLGPYDNGLYGAPMSDVSQSGGQGTITIAHPDVQTMVITVKAN